MRAFSSLSLEELEGLHLEVSGDFASIGIRLSGLTGDFVKAKLLLLANLEQVHLDGVVTINRKNT